MFNLGFWEMVLLAAIALIVVGPEKLPGLARNIGSFLNDLKRTTNSLTSEVTSVMDEENFLKDKKPTQNKDEDADMKLAEKSDD